MQTYYLCILSSCALLACKAITGSSTAQRRDHPEAIAPQYFCSPPSPALPTPSQSQTDSAEVNSAASPGETGCPTLSIPGEATSEPKDDRTKALEFVRQSLFLTAGISSHRRTVLFSIAPGVSRAELVEKLRCVLEGEYSRASDYWALVLSALMEKSDFALYTSDTSDQKKVKIRELLDDLKRNP